MVARSDRDWEQHKIDVYNKLKKYGEKRAKKFIDFYAGRYDRFGRSFLHWHICWSLFDDYNLVKKSGIKWYAICGTGGTGKTTLAKNVCYFLDTSFSADRMKFNAKGIIDVISKFKLVGAMKSGCLDEPDQTIHPNSKVGKDFRSILGKARQQQIFLVYCATDMRDIPSYIYKKITGVFFTPTLGKAMFFKDRTKKASYVVEDIKREYEKKGYGIFYKYLKNIGCIRFDTTRFTALPKEDEERYLKEKREDYKNGLKSFNKHFKDVVNVKPEWMIKRDETLGRLAERGLLKGDIREILGLSKNRVDEILKEFRDKAKHETDA